jgi:hypothetical protein
MDANTMRARFLLGYEGARLANRTFNDREISDFLSKAQEEFVKQRFDSFKNRTQRGYGSGNIRSAELDGLTTGVRKVQKPYRIGTTTINASATTNPFLAGNINNGALRRPDLDVQLNGTGEEPTDHFGVFVSVPDEAMYVLSERVDLVRDIIQKLNIEVKEVTYEYYVGGIYDPYAKPYGNLCWALSWGATTTGTINANGTNVDSTKDYTRLGTGFNMQGTSTQYWNGSIMTTGTVTINTDRARMLIPGKDWDVVGYYITYIVRPPDIVVDVQTPTLQVNCILPDYIHQEIVDNAVKLASASIVPEQGKYQVNQLESKEDE